MYPTAWARIRRWVANAQTEQLTRELFADLVCESGGVYFEMGCPFAKPSRARSLRSRGSTTVSGCHGSATDRGPQSARPGTRRAGRATARAAATRYGVRRSPPLGTTLEFAHRAGCRGRRIRRRLCRARQKLQSSYHVVQQSIFNCAGNVRVSGKHSTQRAPLGSGNKDATLATLTTNGGPCHCDPYFWCGAVPVGLHEAQASVEAFGAGVDSAHVEADGLIARRPGRASL